MSNHLLPGPRRLPIALAALVAAALPQMARAADRIVVVTQPHTVVTETVSATTVAQIPQLSATVLQAAPGETKRLLRRLRSSSGVRYAELDHSVHAYGTPDPGRAAQWGLDAIGAPLAWSHSRGGGVVVAVVDTGVAAAPDLVGRILPGWNVVNGSPDATSCRSISR